MEDFVTYELAIKLKEKGFKEKCVWHYYDDTKDKYQSSSPQCYNYGGNTSDAPTISQVLKWLREERDIDIVVEPINGNTVFMSGERYMVSIYNMRKRDDKIHRENKDKYVSWEEAALGGIQYVLDNNAKNWNYE